jgi:AraC-like DNA-binding protein
MQYRRIRPSPAVEPYVEFYWTLELESAPGYEQRIIRDGRAGIILNFASPFESLAKGVWKSQPECFFVGQITGPLLLRPSGAAKMIGIQCRPNGAAQLLGLPISELTDSAVALDDLQPKLFRQLERVRAMPSAPQSIEALDNILRSFSERVRIDDRLVSYAIGNIEQAGGSVSIKDVAARAGCTARQLERRFRNSVGISPKLFSRMQRFQDVLRVADEPDSDWINAAVRCGYYDQAHLIRDFREFSGKTPTALLDREIDFTQRFLQPREMSHFSNTSERAAR